MKATNPNGGLRHQKTKHENMMWLQYAGAYSTGVCRCSPALTTSTCSCCCCWRGWCAGGPLTNCGTSCPGCAEYLAGGWLYPYGAGPFAGGYSWAGLRFCDGIGYRWGSEDGYGVGSGAGAADGYVAGAAPAMGYAVDTRGALSCSLPV